MKYPFVDKCNSNVPGVSVNVQVYHRLGHGVCTTGVQCLLWQADTKSALSVQPPISSSVDKKLWHVAKKSFENATSLTVNQAEYEHSNRQGQMQHMSLFSGSSKIPGNNHG